MSVSRTNFKSSSDRLAIHEVEKLMPKIKDAENLKSIPFTMDKTPASVSKFSSKNRGKEYSI